MKDFDGQLKLKPDTQLIAEINKEYTLKGSLFKKRGLILWGVNPNNWEATRVKITSDAVYDAVNKKTITKNRAIYDKDLIYVWAINANRAVYKVKRDLVRYIMADAEKQRLNALKQGL